MAADLRAPNYPTVPGIAYYTFIGEICIGENRGTCSCGGVQGTPDMVASALADAIARCESAGWSNVRLHDDVRPVIDMQAMIRLASELTEATGIPVGASEHGGIYVHLGCLVETSLDPTPEAIRAAAAKMTGDIRNLPFRSTNALGGDWFEDEETTLARRQSC